MVVLADVFPGLLQGDSAEGVAVSLVNAINKPFPGRILR